MAVSTEGHGTHGMAVGMIIKVTGMTGLAVAAVDAVQATAYS